MKKYELSVEYARQQHPKLDGNVIAAVGINPYHTALGSKVRTLEFVFDSEQSYKVAYDKLSKIRGVTVIGGNK
jgi:hypothetical protein